MVNQLQPSVVSDKNGMTIRKYDHAADFLTSNPNEGFTLIKTDHTGLL